jgi:hypothetical protein
MSDQVPTTPPAQPTQPVQPTQPLAAPPEHDQLLQATCELIVTTAARCLDAEPETGLTGLALPEGKIVGKQITLDASEGKAHNICRISVMDPIYAPGAEVARIEYEHDKETKHGLTRVYSIQTVRKRAGELILMENFLADSPTAVREADFRPIESESYAQETVLKTLQEWTHYRAYQLQEAHKPQ